MVYDLLIFYTRFFYLKSKEKGGEKKMNYLKGKFS